MVYRTALFSMTSSDRETSFQFSTANISKNSIKSPTKLVLTNHLSYHFHCHVRMEILFKVIVVTEAVNSHASGNT